MRCPTYRVDNPIGTKFCEDCGSKGAFEDSVMRAIKAAWEIHAHVASIDQKYEKMIDRPCPCTQATISVWCSQGTSTSKKAPMAWSLVRTTRLLG